MPKALITPPAALPVSLAELKTHLRIETGDDDDYLTVLLAAALAQVESETGRALISQTWRVYLDEWPSLRECVVELPIAPARAIAEIRVYDADGSPAILAADAYVLDAVSDPPRLLLTDRVDPGAETNGIEIDVEAGYGVTGPDVPDNIRRAIVVLAAFWYENRGTADESAGFAGVPDGFVRLIAPFRRPRL